MTLSNTEISEACDELQMSIQDFNISSTDERYGNVIEALNRCNDLIDEIKFDDNQQEVIKNDRI